MKTLDEMIKAGALFVINHSGGKDSQAMTIKLSKMIPREQLVIVYAHLPEVDWDGSIEHITATCFGIPVYKCQAVKTFFDMVEKRQMFPSPQYRQCTSDLKRGPIDKQIRALLIERGLSMVVSCMGMRAQESPGRRKLETWKLNERNSVAGRTWYDWLPIHDMTTDQVFESIHSEGQKAFWIYYEGATRKSCAFCIMASEHDLKVSARLRPELAQKYIETEERIGFTLRMDRKPLREILAGK